MQIAAPEQSLDSTMDAHVPPSPATFNRWSELVEAQPGWRRIGKIVVDRGYVSAAGVDAALSEQYYRGAAAGSLLDILIARGSLTEEQASRALTEQIVSYYLPALAHSLAGER